MPNFAVVDNNRVINIILANNIDDAKLVTGKECIDVTNGWTNPSGIDGAEFFPATPVTTQATN